MKITVAKNAGFCKGVAFAVDKALELAAAHEKVYTIGALIHNEGVVAYLEERGVHAISLEEARQLPAGRLRSSVRTGYPSATRNICVCAASSFTTRPVPSSSVSTKS